MNLTQTAQRVPRTYYAKRLLEHGPLTAAEFKVITGWPENTAAQTLFQLTDTGIARKYRRPGLRHYEYRLA